MTGADKMTKPTAKDAPPPIGVEVWRGGVNTWDCDEMGHMNVRFYVSRALEGVANLAAQLGMPHAFTPYAASTLLVTDHHLRFLREAHAGAPLHMTGGVVRLGECDATLLLILVHSRTGLPAATFITRVLHAHPRDGRGFPWPRRAFAAAERLMVEIPDYAAPRSVTSLGAPPLHSVASGAAARLTRIGLGVISPSATDVFGRMRCDEFIGRVSDGVGGLLAGVREAVAAAAVNPPKRTGGAVLEYRLSYLDWPRAGDHVSLHSGLAGYDDKTQRLGHWLLDPISGEAWGFAEAVAVNFDLDTRKSIPIADEAKTVLATFVRPDLRFVTPG